MTKKISTILLLLASTLAVNADNVNNSQSACQMVEDVCIKNSSNSYLYFKNGTVYSYSPNEEPNISLIEYECNGNKLICENADYSGTVKISDNKLNITNAETNKTITLDIVETPAAVKKLVKEISSEELMLKRF